jgi:lipoprotein NlpD
VQPGGWRVLTVTAAALLATGCIPHDPRFDAPPPQRDYPQDRSSPDRGQDYPPPDRYEPQRVDDAGREGGRGARTLAAPPPAWQARPVTPNAQSVTSTTYTVQPGDTLRGIGDRTGAGSEAIARANALTPPFVVRPGQRLEIPGGRYHLVRAGETGIAIARAYGVDWSKIVTANELTEPYILRTGMRVMIPGPAGSPAAERAAAFRLDIDDIVTGSQPAIAANERPARPTTSSTKVVSSFTPIAEPSRLRGTFDWPVRGRVVSHFGPGASGEKFNGIKIAVPKGTPILASADGVVAYAGNEIANLGGLVIIRHGDSWTTVYGHASQLLVQRGQQVKRGQQIALSGDTGFADRPELHFEIRKGRLPVDPLAELPR